MLMKTPEPSTEPEVAAEPAKATKAIKPKTKHKISFIKLCEKFLNKIKD